MKELINNRANERARHSLVAKQGVAKQISPHLVRIFEVVRRASHWLTAPEIAAKANVAKRTAGQHVQHLTDLGEFERSVMFTGFRYRLSPRPSGRAVDIIAEIEAVRQVLAEQSP